MLYYSILYYSITCYIARTDPPCPHRQGVYRERESVAQVRNGSVLQAYEV